MQVTYGPLTEPVHILAGAKRGLQHLFAAVLHSLCWACKARVLRAQTGATHLVRRRF